ncbi:hypothetical protein O3P69_018968 [Scylla paramamosain]|uniref:Integrase catalytic domain-containing protein n=1 Tax=Scylla paramamosain TaxID=85552 RepID=A0AAW0S9C0_SCYPA
MAQLLGVSLYYTTAYYPQANGMVGRLHRHMKIALKARFSGPDWINDLLWLLLGIYTAPEDDMATSSVELVYSVPLTVPGDFIPAPRGQQDHPLSILSSLRGENGTHAPILTSQQVLTPTYVPSALHNSHYVLLRRDVLYSPLMKPYEGLIRVLQRQPKAFIIDYGSRHETLGRFTSCNPAPESDRHNNMRRHALRLRSPDQDILLYGLTVSSTPVPKGRGVMGRHGTLNLRAIVYQLESPYRSSNT